MGDSSLAAGTSTAGRVGRGAAFSVWKLRTPAARASRFRSSTCEGGALPASWRSSSADFRDFATSEMSAAAYGTGTLGMAHSSGARLERIRVLGLPLQRQARNSPVHALCIAGLAWGLTPRQRLGGLRTRRGL